MGEHLPTGRKAVQHWLNRQEQQDRKNARVIDKIMAALPLELSPPQWQDLIRVYLRKVTQGRAAWLAAIHHQGEDQFNPHVHILIRDRDIDTRERVARLSEKGSTERLRQLWEETVNKALEQAGYKTRIDRRSLQDQGIDRRPQRHRGPRRNTDRTAAAFNSLAPPESTISPPYHHRYPAQRQAPESRQERTYTFPARTCAPPFQRASEYFQKMDSKMCFRTRKPSSQGGTAPHCIPPEDCRHEREL